MNFNRFAASLILVSLLFFIAGCDLIDDANPIPNWKSLGLVEGNRFDQWITDEYKAYLKTLPPEIRKQAEYDDAADNLEVEYLEDGYGQHAIRIDMGVNGTYWHHVLIYDKFNKRVKVLVYKLGHYSC